MRAKTLMIQGAGSSVGKSLLTTALCRLLRRRGLSVAPFKSQNMSLNSFITRDGSEIGRAQAVQAEAAGIEPSALMNPILLKPAADHTSQVIVGGRARAVMSAREYHSFRRTLRAEVFQAFDALSKQHDLVVMEGAGSPAEINLRENDLANMGMAEMADAPVLLVGDIDRGGVFASLYGTIALLEEDERRRVRGLIINKFRGDVSILEPGLRRLEELLERPVLGVLPYRRFLIDEEDSLTERIRPRSAACPSGSARLDIVVVRLSRLSNFTDFTVFDRFPDVFLRYVDSPDDLGSPDLLIIPGARNTVDDMRFLEQSGLAAAILGLHDRGMPLVGICGGFQMLGKRIRDPLSVGSGHKEVKGLGLLDMESLFVPNQQTVRTRLAVSADRGLLQGAEGMILSGCEIRQEQSKEVAFFPLGHTDQGIPKGAVNPAGNVIGACLHGMFDNLEFTRVVLNNLRRSKGLSPLTDAGTDYAALRQAEYDRLADMVEEHLDMAAVIRIIEEWP